MDDAIVGILRLIHIIFGAFWVGGALVTGFFLLPTVKATGPVGGQFVGQLMARTHLPTVLTAAGGVTVLAGLILYGMRQTGMGFSGPPAWYAIGGAIAIVVMVIGATVSKPSAGKLAALGQKMASQGSPPTAEQSTQREQLMNRLTISAQINGVLLVIAIALMALANY